LNRGFCEREAPFDTYGEVHLGEDERDILSIPIVDGSTLPSPSLCEFLSLVNAMEEDSDVIEFWKQYAKPTVNREYELCDLRLMCFKTLRMIILAYSIDNAASFESIYTTWMPLLSQHFPNVPIFLVGTKRDLRPKPSLPPEEMIAESELSPTSGAMFNFGESSSSFFSESNLPASSVEIFLVHLCGYFFQFVSLETIILMKQCCRQLNDYVNENLLAIFMEKVKVTGFVSPLMGKLMQRLIGAIDWCECCCLSMENKKAKQMRIDFLNEKQLNREVYNIGVIGPVGSKAPELDRLWAKVVRYLTNSNSKAEKLIICKWD
jgi:GTPase SAR1 family protein